MAVFMFSILKQISNDLLRFAQHCKESKGRWQNGHVRVKKTEIRPRILRVRRREPDGEPVGQKVG